MSLPRMTAAVCSALALLLGSLVLAGVGGSLYVSHTRCAWATPNAARRGSRFRFERYRPPGDRDEQVRD